MRRQNAQVFVGRGCGDAWMCVDTRVLGIYININWLAVVYIQIFSYKQFSLSDTII